MAAAVICEETKPIGVLAGVVNRSQHDINTNRDMKEAVTAEAAFFDSRCVGALS